MAVHTFNTRIQLSAGLLAVLLLVGCAKEKMSVTPEAPSEDPIVETGSIPEIPAENGDSRDANSYGLSWDEGNTVEFSPVSESELQKYVGRLHALNAPSEHKINVNLKDIGNGRYAGEVQIGYKDNGRYFVGVFASGEGTNSVSYKNRTTGLSEAEYNQWFRLNNKDVFHAFFQDQYGAIVFVIDEAIGSGDGTVASSLSGSIWYRNFPILRAFQSAEKCWFLVEYAYECRTFLVGDVIKTTSALYPSNGYRKLGGFSGLNRNKAFNL